MKCSVFALVARVRALRPCDSDAAADRVTRVHACRCRTAFTCIVERSHHEARNVSRSSRTRSAVHLAPVFQPNADVGACGAALALNPAACAPPPPPAPAAPPAAPALTAGRVLQAFQRIPLPHLRSVTQPDEKTLVNFDTIFYVDADQFQRTLTLLGRHVTLAITPSTFTWHHGDGTTRRHERPGRAVPQQGRRPPLPEGASHRRAQRHDRVDRALPRRQRTVARRTGIRVHDRPRDRPPDRRGGPGADRPALTALPNPSWRFHGHARLGNRQKT